MNDGISTKIVDIDQSKLEAAINQGGIEHLREELLQGTLDLPGLVCEPVEAKEHTYLTADEGYATDIFGRKSTTQSVFMPDEYITDVKAEIAKASEQGVLNIVCKDGTPYSTELTVNGQKLTHVTKAVITIDAETNLVTADLTFILPVCNVTVQDYGLTTVELPVN